MAKYIFKRILTAIPLIIVITILCFSLIHLAGRNPEWKLRLFYRDKNEYFR